MPDVRLTSDPKGSDAEHPLERRREVKECLLILFGIVIAFALCGTRKPPEPKMTVYIDGAEFRIYPSGVVTTPNKSEWRYPGQDEIIIANVATNDWRIFASTNSTPSATRTTKEDAFRVIAECWKYADEKRKQAGGAK